MGEKRMERGKTEGRWERERERERVGDERKKRERKEGERELHVASYLAWNSFVHSECDIFSMESQRQCV
jgi:hypothetical protein